MSNARNARNARNAHDSGQRSKMQLLGASGEAVRDILSGTTHALLYAVALMTIMVTAAGAELFELRSINDRIDDYVSSGASTYIVEYPGRIDARSCESLAGVPGVHAAGAIRTADSRISFAVLPSTSLPLLEATPGAVQTLASANSRDTRALTSSESSGIWLSGQAAETLGLASGQTARLTDDTRATIAGVYPSPEDGRSSNTTYAVVQPVPRDGVFDECLIKTWPVPDSIESLALLSVGAVSDDGDNRPTVRQLNTRLGVRLDSSALFISRATAWMPLLAGCIALALGFVSVWIRRLELASALHCGVPKPALTLQMMLETLSWTVAAAILCMPLPLAVMHLWAGAAPQQIVTLTLRPMLAAALGSLAGATIATICVRERNLFAYFKRRI